MAYLSDQWQQHAYYGCQDKTQTAAISGGAVMQVTTMHAASAVEVAVMAWEFIEGVERGGRGVVALAHGMHGDIAVEGGSVRDFCYPI